MSKDPAALAKLHGYFFHGHALNQFATMLMREWESANDREMFCNMVETIKTRAWKDYKEAVTKDKKHERPPPR